MEPEFFMNRYKELLKDKFKDLPKYISKTLTPSIRINTLKIEEKDLIKRLEKRGIKLEKIKFLKYGYRATAKFSLGSTQEYLQGYYYIQEAATQLPAEILDSKPNELILDCCAAPGGKLTQLSQLMKNKGIVIGLDIKDDRLKALKNNIERMGITNSVIYKKDLRDVQDLNLKFDKILLDAPCSGNFMIDKSWFQKRDLEGIKRNAELQKKLLKSALSVLKDNGVLVYSTCSLEPEENEEVINWAKDNINIKVEEQKRLWPHIDNTQGFFLAKIIKE